MEPPLVVFLLLFAVTLTTLTRSKLQRRFEFVERPAGSKNPVAEAISKGYNTITRISARPFTVQYWANDYLILPAKYLPDVRRAHREHLTFVDTAADLFCMYNWIRDLFKSQRMVFAIIKGVNPHLPKLGSALFEESSLAFENEFGDLKNPKTVVALDAMTKISVRVMTRIIAGTELARNKTFLSAINSYFNGSFLCGLIMLNLPFAPWLRDIVAWPLWKYHQVFNQDRVISLIKPVVAQRMDDHANGRIPKDQFDAVTCTLNMLSDFPFDPNSEFTPVHVLSHETLQLIWAAGQSPAMSITTMMFKLLELPEYVEPLREEAQKAIDKHGWNDGIFHELPMMDSFIRETHRLHPSFSLNATRYVKGQPFVLHDGTTLPVGTRIGFPAEALQRDPNIIENPDVFDGFRFVKLAAADVRQEDNLNRWNASHCSYSNLSFGYGNHACPGRFIAVRHLKIMLCRLLLQYDFSWDFKDGEPPRFIIEGATVPNVSQKVTLRRRTAA